MRSRAYTTLPLQLASLAGRKQWFLYRLIFDEEAGKWKKVPSSPFPPYYAIKAIDPAQRTTLQGALQWLDIIPENMGNWSLGFWFTASDPYFFLDIDAIDYATDEGEPLSPERLQHFNQMRIDRFAQQFAGAWIEMSTSGTGFHIIGTYSGDRPAHRSRNEAQRLELYTADRGVCIGPFTHTAFGNPDTVLDDALDDLIDEYFPPEDDAIDMLPWSSEPRAEWNGPDDDDELIKLALKTKVKHLFQSPSETSAPTFKQLWTVDTKHLVKFPKFSKVSGIVNGSALDMAVASHLAFYTGCNMERIKRIMYSNAQLVRPKWVKHKKYLAATIRRACSTCTAVYNQYHNPFADNVIKAAEQTVTQPEESETANVPPVLTNINGSLVAQLPTAGPTLAQFSHLLDGGDATATAIDNTDPDAPLATNTILPPLQIPGTTPSVEEVSQPKLSEVASTAIVNAMIAMDAKRFVLNDVFKQLLNLANLVSSGEMLTVEKAIQQGLKTRGYSISPGHLRNAMKAQVTDYNDMSDPVLKEAVDYFHERYLHRARDGWMFDTHTVGRVMNPSAFDDIEEGNVPQPMDENFRPSRFASRIAKCRLYDMEVSIPTAPGEPPIMHVPSIVGSPAIANTYNYKDIPRLMEGQTISKTAQRAFDILQQHAFRFCHEDEELTHMMLSYIAHLIRNPHLKMHWALVLVGIHGDGKSIWGDVLHACKGPSHVRNVSLDEARETYSDYMVGPQETLVFEEMQVEDLTTKKRMGNSMKELISQDRVSIARKGQPGLEIPNYKSILMTGNNHTQLPIEANDRRYLIIAPTWYLALGSKQDAFRERYGFNKEGLHQYLDPVFRIVKGGNTPKKAKLRAELRELFVHFELHPSFKHVGNAPALKNAMSTALVATSKVDDVIEAYIHDPELTFATHELVIIDLMVEKMKADYVGDRFILDYANGRRLKEILCEERFGYTPCVNAERTSVGGRKVSYCYKLHKPTNETIRTTVLHHSGAP